ncbi:MAG: hypothetical protein L3J62_06625 [Gammaproteobacteria bacterium]|nr:hypothetical protein [Gammaproteobacteria bacterium]MCF6230452.1 hypothetical protein [Gammaproteobacteria bacterium]
MPNITFCWELGAGYGHLASIAPLAQSLTRRGHTLSALLRDTRSADKFLDTSVVNSQQAPHWIPTKKYHSPTISYADILSRCGYDSTDSLLPLVQQWRERFSEYTTELIIADHSPTALIAAKTLKLPVALSGTGFSSPPPIYPLPPITPWLNTQPDFLLHLEKSVLDIINDVLRHFDTTELDYLHQLFDVEESFLCTLPELDHYEQRSMDAYWGPRFTDSRGVEADWPQNGRKNIFVYINNRYKLLDTLLSSLSRVDANFIVHCSGVEGAVTDHYSANNIQFSAEPVRIKSLAGKADLVISHAGHGTVAACLLMGIPLLLLPTQLEQLLLAGKLSHFKLAHSIDPRGAKQPDFAEQIRSTLNDEACQKQAEQFAEHYKGFDPQQQLDEIVFACEALLSQ